MPSPEVINAFRAIISTNGKPFQVLDHLGGSSARVRFLGMFNNEEALWDARITTLTAVLRESLEQGTSPMIAPRQFIDIGPEGADGRAITIGLHVPVIDQPTVWKTVTMVRNYKRLRVGRIEWGQGPAYPK